MKENLNKHFDVRLIKSMLNNLRALGFEPHAIDKYFVFTTPKTYDGLLDTNMMSWPGDIVWLKTDALPKNRPRRSQPV